MLIFLIGFESQPVTTALYSDVLLQFFNNSSFGSQRQFPDLTTGEIDPSYQSNSMQDYGLVLPTDQYFESESSFSTNLIQSMLSRSWILGIDDVASSTLAQEARLLLSTNNIRKFVSLYFREYYTNCPMIYAPTFDPELVPSSLLAAVVFMGAMYSDNPSEVRIAKKLLDLAELFVFSTPLFSPEMEIRASFTTGYGQLEDMKDWETFQNLQAAYLMLITQYWGGNQSASNRMVETRMPQVISVCSSLYLFFIPSLRNLHF